MILKMIARGRVATLTIVVVLQLGTGAAAPILAVKNRRVMLIRVVGQGGCQGADMAVFPPTI